MLITLLYFIIFSFLLLTRYAQVCEVCAVCARNRSEDEICLKVIFAYYKKKIPPKASFSHQKTSTVIFIEGG